MMNIALLGYGKMGRAIEALALEAGHRVVLKTNSRTRLDELESPRLPVDVALEFSTPIAAPTHILFALEQGWPVVSGSTGWLDKLPLIEEKVKTANGTFLYAANFSLGVNLFFRLNTWLARLLARQDYRPQIEEIHHIHKKDAPSGTAIRLAEDLVRLHPRLENWVPGPTGREDELPVFSLRQGEVPGTHVVTYRGANDEITISHKALNRLGFATGALAVAEWIRDKKGLLSMDDFLDDNK